MFKVSKSRLASMATAPALLYLTWNAANASDFAVSPIQLQLSHSNTSTELRITNQGRQKIRFSVSGYAWKQTPWRQMELTPSDDLVFFPAIFSLLPTEERLIRIGATTAPQEMERSFRIIVDELPPLDMIPNPLTPGLHIVVRTRLNIPLFLASERPTKSIQIRSLTLRHGEAGFEVTNPGSVHVKGKSIVISGFSPSGAPTFHQTIASWYILAGQTHRYAQHIPFATCAATHAYTVKFIAEEMTYTQSFSNVAGDCGV